MVSKINNKAKKIVLGCSLSAAATLAYFYNMDILVLICTLCYVCYALLQPIESSLLFIALSIPNTRVLGWLDISASVIICAATAFRILLFNRGRAKKALVVLLMLFIVISAQFCFRPSGITYGVVFPLKMILVLFYFHEIVAFLPREKTSVIKNTCDYLLCGAIVLVGLSVILGSSSRISAIKNDPNMLAIEMAFIIATYCVLYLKYAIVTQRRFIVIWCVCAAVIFATGSRMGLFLLAMVFTVTLVMNFRQLGKLLLPIMIVFIVASLVLSSDWGNSVVNTLVNRSDAMVSRGDISNGRFDLWTSYYGVLTSNWLNVLFGIGGNYAAYGLESVAHNMIFEDWASYGIIGVLILLLIYFAIYKNIRRHSQIKEKTCIYVWLPLCVPIVGGLTLHGLTSIPNILMLFVGMMIACEKTSELRGRFGSEQASALESREGMNI